MQKRELKEKQYNTYKSALDKERKDFFKKQWGLINEKQINKKEYEEKLLLENENKFIKIEEESNKKEEERKRKIKLEEERKYKMFLSESQNKDKDSQIKAKKEKEDEMKRMEFLNELNKKADKYRNN